LPRGRSQEAGAVHRIPISGATVEGIDVVWHQVKTIFDLTLSAAYGPPSPASLRRQSSAART
jgi:hypothetical protein